MKKLTLFLLISALVLVGCASKESQPVGEKSAALERMEGLRAEDIKYITSNFHNIEAQTLADALNAAAAGGIAGVEDGAELSQNFYWFDVYLSGGPDVYSSDDERFYFEAGLDEPTVWVDYHDGNGGVESFCLADAALYTLLRENFRSDGFVDAAEYEKYGAILEARAQERVDRSAEMTGARPYTAYEITDFAAVDRFETDGFAFEVFQWGVAFVPEDPYGVGWAGGMFLDADGRVCALEQDTYFAVRTAPDGTQEHRFLFWDLYLGAAVSSDSDAGKEKVRANIVQAFEE